MKRTLDSRTLLGETEENFSLVLGGPLYQLWRRLHAAGPTLDLLMRRMIGIPLVAWLPLLVLTVYEGVAIGRVVRCPSSTTWTRMPGSWSPFRFCSWRKW